jgi:hypothetical protein
VSDADIIAEGRAAWKQIKARATATWIDWLSVGHALIAARAVVMRQVGTNKPVGGTYNRAMGRWLRENGFDGINTSERYNAAKCAENEEAIEGWRETLPDIQRRKYNSASCVWNYYKKATKQETKGKRGPHNGKSARIIELENRIAQLKARIAELESALALRNQLDTILEENGYGTFAREVSPASHGSPPGIASSRP